MIIHFQHKSGIRSYQLRSFLTHKPKYLACVAGCSLLGSTALRWRHNGCDSVSNHQPRECLLRRLITSKKISKFRVTGLCAGNSPETGEFPEQMASNAENVSIWWRHHGDRKIIYIQWLQLEFASNDHEVRFLFIELFCLRYKLETLSIQTCNLYSNLLFGVADI